MKDPIDVFLVRKSFSANVAVCGGVINGLSSTVDLLNPSSPDSFVNPPELLRSLAFCLSSVPGKLVELLRDLNDGSWGFSPPSWNDKSTWGFSWWELWCRLVVLLWGSGRSCHDSYGFVPVYNGRVLCSSPAVWVFSWGDEGSVG